MLDLERMIRAGAAAAAATSIVAAPFDLPDQLCQDLAREGLILGYVASCAPQPGQAGLPVAGWWIDRTQGRWSLRRQDAATILFLGAGDQIRLRMLWGAQRSGIRRIVLVGADGVIVGDLDVRSALISRVKSAAVRGLLNTRAFRRGGTALLRLGGLSYENAFDELFDLLGDRLRLPAGDIVGKRALLVSGSLGPGGAERQLAYTAAGIAARREYEVIVGCNHLDPPLANFHRETVERAGAMTWQVPASVAEFESREMQHVRNRLARYDALGFQNVLHVIFHYAMMMRAVRPALVHTWMDYCNVLAGIAAELVDVRGLVLSGRSVAPDNFGIFQPYMRPGYLALLRRRNVVFLNNSQAGADDYARWLGKPREYFTVIRNGFTFPSEIPALARVTTRRQHDIAEQAVVVGSLIRFSEEKRPQLLIDTACLLAARHSNLRFLVFGGGPMLEDMRALVAARKLSGVIRLPGLTNDAWSALAAMDIFILTSRMEGLPNVLVEAQACGLPVVCTAVGGVPETFIEGETGFGVHVANAQALSEAISRLVLDSGLRARMSQQAFRHVREKFAVDKMVRATLDAYHGALTPQRPGEPSEKEVLMNV